MTKEEYTNQGGKAADYERANNLYMSIDGMWVDRHEFQKRTGNFATVTGHDKAWEIVGRVTAAGFGFERDTDCLFSVQEYTRRAMKREEGEIANECAELERQLAEHRELLKEVQEVNEHLLAE